VISSLFAELLASKAIELA